MQHDFSNLANIRSSSNAQDRRFACAIAALARMLEQIAGVTLELANIVLQERKREP